MKNFRTKLAVTTTIALTLPATIAQQAKAVTFNFNWTGNIGYSARGSFRYDENTAPAIISESGAGPTNSLQSLTVSFFDPSNTPLQSFNTVAGGVSTSAFFQFNFNTTTQQLFGDFNVGGGTGAIGEQFFNGPIGGLLRLREITGPGTNNLLDFQNIGTITVSQIPEPSSVLGLLALGTLGASSLCSRKSKK